MYKSAITLTGTAHDKHGKINIESECDGFNIEKKDLYHTGKIVLTRDELKAMLKAIEENFPQRTLTEEEQAQEALNRG